MATIPFAQARAHVLQLGRYTGQTIDRAASTDAGLLYLDWLSGQLEMAEHPTATQRTTYDHLVAYLTDPTIARELTAALPTRSHRRDRS